MDGEKRSCFHRLSSGQGVEQAKIKAKDSQKSLKASPSAAEAKWRRALEAQIEKAPAIVQETERLLKAWGTEIDKSKNAGYERGREL